MELEAKIRASAVAHAIRLAKRPLPGMTMEGNAEIKTIDEADFAAGRIDKAVADGPPQRIWFTVTQEDIDGAIALINAQAAVYREPKTTIVR